MERVAGIDSNILVYALDPDLPEHDRAKTAILESRGICLNPTVVHETYHTLVFRRKTKPVDTEAKIAELLDDDLVIFVNQTKTVTEVCLRLAVKHGLGGRDALIIGSYLYGGMRLMLTHDRQILGLGSISLDRDVIDFRDPVGSSA